MEHRKKRGMLGSIGDLFDGPTGIGDALGLGLGDSGNMAIELVAAGAAGAASIKAVGIVEGYYVQIPVVGPMIAKYQAATPAIRIALGAGAAMGLSMLKYPGAKAVATGVGVTLVASGALDLVSIAQKSRTRIGRDRASSEDDGLVDGLNGPMLIREEGETERFEQLNGLPLRSRDVSPEELALGDYSYLQ